MKTNVTTNMKAIRRNEMNDPDTELKETNCKT